MAKKSSKERLALLEICYDDRGHQLSRYEEAFEIIERHEDRLDGITNEIGGLNIEFEECVSHLLDPLEPGERGSELFRDTIERARGLHREMVVHLHSAAVLVHFDALRKEQNEAVSWHENYVARSLKATSTDQTNS